MKGRESHWNGNISLAAPPVPRSVHSLRTPSWPHCQDASPPSADVSLRAEDSGPQFPPRFSPAVSSSPCPWVSAELRSGLSWLPGPLLISGASVAWTFHSAGGPFAVSQLPCKPSSPSAHPPLLLPSRRGQLVQERLRRPLETEKGRAR